MNMNTKKSVSTLVLALGLLGLVSTAQAQSIQCGTKYTVRPGDSLTKISNEVYNSVGDFQIIYSANSATIGSNPGQIEVGMKLDIPCLDKETEESTANVEAITITPTTKSLPVPKQDVIRVVAGGNWAPFLTEEQAQGGMLTEIVNVALEGAEGSPEYRIDFINDWGAHLRPLVSDHRYDFSLAWFRPNCDLVDRLGDGSKFRCNNLLWSEVLFEQILGYHMLAGKPAPTSYEDLYGQTICRPAGYSTFMLEEHGLVEPNVKLVRAASPQECFKGLGDGSIDLVAIAVDTAKGAIKSEGLTGRVTAVEPLSQVLTIHAVTSNTNPNAEANLKVLNDSLLEMKSTGKWFNIVRRHLSEFRAANN